MKKSLSAILCLCMLLSILPANVFAASPVNIFNVTVTEPKVGEKPVYEASVPATASTYVTKTEWSGELDSNGCFKVNTAYTVNVTVRLKPGQDKYLKYVASTTKVNTKLAEVTYISSDKQEAIITYTFASVANAASTVTTNTSGLTEPKTIGDLSVINAEWEVLRLCNIERAKEGLESMSMIQALQEGCNIREKEISTKFSHTRPNGEQPQSVIPEKYKWGYTAENIADGQRSSKQVVTEWMVSTGHRAAIMHKELGYMGVGFYKPTYSWVQLFAGRKNTVSFTVSTDKRVFSSKEEILSEYMTLTASNGVVSYLPLDFDSMVNNNGNYTPRISADNLPVFSLTAEAIENEKNKPDTSEKFENLSVNDYEWELLRLTNVERAKVGADSLSMPQSLQLTSNIRETDLAEKYSHTRPDGTMVNVIMSDEMRYGFSGENIAKGATPEAAIKDLLKQTTYCKNLLRNEFGYAGIGYTDNGNRWVQIFGTREEVIKYEVSTQQREFSSNDEIKQHYIKLTDDRGIVSYLPLDFDSMKKVGDKYYPRINAKSLPGFTKSESFQSTEKPSSEPEPVLKPEEPTVTNPNENKISDIEEGGLFGKYIPITHVYGTDFFVAYNMEAGKTHRFSIGTRFLNETDGWSPTVAPPVKRVDYQGHYVKVNYLGTYGTVGEKIAVDQLGIIEKEEYDKVMRGEESEWAKAYNLTKDTIVISTEIYDANKKFVRKLSPACVIVLTDASGNFVTFSKFLGASCTNLFSQIDNFFAPDEDKSRSTKSFAFESDKLMLASKADAEKLMPSKEIVKYEFLTYPELSGDKQYNTNHILDDDEFVTPDNVYYQVGVDFKAIDPVIKNEIKDVICYSYYTHTIDTLYTQRNIVTADGTLYGVTSKYEKKVIATNIKKATANHYLTNSGEVKELNGKVVATDVYDYEESNDGWVIGILKNDCSFHMGYTYIEGKDGYSRGLSEIMKDVKAVVPNGLVTKDNAFYRWNNDIEMTGYGSAALSSGEFVSNWDLKLGLTKVCDNAERIFPYEYLTKVYGHTDENKAQNIYGFVQNSSGKLYGYSSKYHAGFGTYSNKVERIFPVFSSAMDGNFVGIKIENQSNIDVIACRICDGNSYKSGPLIGGAAYLCETQGGYYGVDGKVYGLNDKPAKGATNNGTTPFECTSNYITNNPNMHRGTATYRAYSRDTDSNIPLLSSVYTWMYDNHRTILLERTDGTVWTASVMHPSTNADLIAMVGGYESSNVFQVSPATTKKVDAEFVKVGEMLSPAVSMLQFTDVKADAWYAEPVKWAVDKGITNGTSATTFSPDATCTRAQILTFLWRAVGSPKMGNENPFSDVKNTDYYYDAALWAYGKGMVTESTFAGDTPCTRSATVVYLWKNAGAPYTSYYGTFSDVTAGSGYASAVAWAVNNGVTSGTSETTFSPDTTCTRGQIVTFLMRTLNK